MAGHSVRSDREGHYRFTALTPGPLHRYGDGACISNTSPRWHESVRFIASAILVLSPAGAAAEVITLTGILDSDITADIGNLLELVSFTEDSPLNYSATNLAGSPPPPFGPSPTHPIDFGVFLRDLRG